MAGAIDAFEQHGARDRAELTMIVAQSADLLRDAKEVAGGFPLCLREQEPTRAIAIVEHLAQRGHRLHADPAAGRELRGFTQWIACRRRPEPLHDPGLDAEPGVEPTAHACEQRMGTDDVAALTAARQDVAHLSLIHISEPTRLLSISYAVFCLK